jgi:hypothetical protein
MSDRVSIPTIAGALTSHINVDYAIAHFATAQTLEKFEPAVLVAPSGGSGSVSVDVRTATGGGGSGLSATIPDGAKVPATPVTGSVTIAADTTLYLRITAEAATAPTDLYGNIEVSGAADVTTALTTLARVKAWKSISASTDDDLLNTIIMGVSKRCQTYMTRNIVQLTNVSEKQSGVGRELPLVLREYPVIVPPAVAIRDVEGDTVATTDYDVDEEAGLVHKATDGVVSSWTEGLRNYEVDYTSGFATVPEDLALAATAQVVHVFLNATAGAGRQSLDSTINDAGGSASFLQGEWAPGVRQTLDGYRERRAG